MGESTATYAHADQVAELTEQVQRDYPEALAWALGRADVLHDAIAEHTSDSMVTFFIAHQYLVFGLLADVDEPHDVANDVLTAALYVANGIDWAAVSVEVHQLDDGRWRVATDSGHGVTDVPIRVS